MPIALTKIGKTTRTNYEGMKVGKLNIIQKVPAPSHIKRKGPTYYECRCDCGKTTIVNSSNLTNFIKWEKNGKFTKRPRSCGCGAIHLSTGMVVGKLTLLDKVSIHTDNLPKRNGVKYKGTKKRRHKVHYNCRCECGNKKLVQADLLIKNIRYKTEQNAPLSCGCVRKATIDDIVGKAVGNTIIREVKRTCIHTNKTIYECKCGCGNLFTRGRASILYYIRENKEFQCESCSTSAKMFKIGDVIDKLKIMEFIDKIKPRYKSDIYDYKCRCVCGNEIIKTKYQLNTYANQKYEKSCGCETKKQKLLNIKKYKSIPISYLDSIKNGAKERNIEHTVSDDYVSELYHKQNKKCALTGKNIWFFCDLENSGRKTNASLDRIDNDRGYIEGNVQWVDKKINMFKLAWGVEEFKQMCKEVAEFNYGYKKNRKRDDSNIADIANAFFEF